MKLVFKILQASTFCNRWHQLLLQPPLQSQILPITVQPSISQYYSLICRVRSQLSGWRQIGEEIINRLDLLLLTIHDQLQDAHSAIELVMMHSIVKKET